jgi:sporulation protein YlmC with PRC-barrel domain
MRLTRIMTATAIAAALAIPAAGFAQTSTAPNATPPAATTPAPKAATPDTAPKAAAPDTSSKAAAPATAQTARHVGADQMRASKMIGAAVYDQGDQKLGTIADLVVDRDGRVADVVIGLGDKNVAVKMADLKHGKDNHLVLSHSKDALKHMATFDLSAEPAKSGSSTR